MTTQSSLQYNWTLVCCNRFCVTILHSALLKWLPDKLTFRLEIAGSLRCFTWWYFKLLVLNNNSLDCGFGTVCFVLGFLCVYVRSPWRSDRAQEPPSEFLQACLGPECHRWGGGRRWRSGWIRSVPRSWSWRSQRTHRGTGTRTADWHTSADREGDSNQDDPYITYFNETHVL